MGELYILIMIIRGLCCRERSALVLCHAGKNWWEGRPLTRLIYLEEEARSGVQNGSGCMVLWCIEANMCARSGVEKACVEAGRIRRISGVIQGKRETG
jgi:hypothetical protein